LIIEALAQECKGNARYGYESGMALQVKYPYDKPE
jgi:hypothetical protein